MTTIINSQGLKVDKYKGGSLYVLNPVNTPYQC